MYKEVFRGYDTTQKPELQIFANNSDGINYDEIIIDTGYFFSNCEHHMCPFMGSYFFGYIPNKYVIGLSKIARTVDYFAAKLQIQERLGSEVLNYICKEIEPQGAILILKARHLCKEMRGVKKVGGEMTTSKVVGLFKEKPELELKFMELVKLK